MSSTDKMLRLNRWNVRIVDTGDRYGLNDGLVNNKEQMIEIYDTTFPDDGSTRGAFASRYYTETFLAHDGALGLMGYEPNWVMSKAEVKAAQAWWYAIDHN